MLFNPNVEFGKKKILNFFDVKYIIYDLSQMSLFHSGNMTHDFHVTF